MSAVIDFAGCPEVESIPGKVSGAWVFKDTRLPLWCLFELLEDFTVEEFCSDRFYPTIKPEQVRAVLSYMKEQVTP